MNKVEQAIIYATEKHCGQKRKGTDTPYIVHPMEAMEILVAMGCSESVIVAGILHDVLEDTNATSKEVESLFGLDVLAIVQSESEDKSKTWKERKSKTLEELKEASTETKLVCFADKLSNIRSMYKDQLQVGEELWKRFNADKKDIEWYYRGILNCLEDIPITSPMNLMVCAILFKEFKNTINEVFA